MGDTKRFVIRTVIYFYDIIVNSLVIIKIMKDKRYMC